MSSLSSCNDRSVLSARLEGTWSKSPEASVSGSLSSGMPSPVDAKSLRDLKVMKSCHDVTSIMIEESLGLIRARAMDLDTLRRKPKMSSGKTFSVARAASSPPKVEEVRVEAMSKMLVGNAAMRAQWLNLTYSMKIWDNSQATSEFGRGVLHANLAKELYTLPFEGHHYQMALLDRVHDADRLVTIMGNRASHMEEEIKKLKSEGDLEQLAIAQQLVVELQADNAKMMSELGEATQRVERADMELNEVRADLADSQHQLKEQKASRWKSDDDLLKMMKENEAIKIELPSKYIMDYKQSVEFGWGLRQMGQVSYEYGYRVALAHFQVWHPDIEVDIDPFTKKSEKDTVFLEAKELLDPALLGFHLRHFGRADGWSGDPR
ncbi:hypothetical protein GW17_00011718 [Ensete ventricosum]|nr:hypothetical protein GW17_00011718 [Ensete ventricosum]